MRMFNLALAIQTICLLLTPSNSAPPRFERKAESFLYHESSLSPAEAIQVTGPPPDYGPIIHTEILTENVFGNSHYQPLQIKYVPPTKKFSRVTLTLKTRVYGVQYDRLVHIFMSGREIWRSSTAEPGSHNITSTFTKDVSNYISLFRTNQNLTIQLDNIVNDEINGPITATLIARYYYPEIDVDHGKGRAKLYDGEGDLLWQQFSGQVPPDGIMSILPDQEDSLSRNKSILHWTIPPSLITKQLQAMPRNVTRAVIEISATGYDEEEFWYSNLINEYAASIQGTDGGPSRVIEVLINNRIAGFVFPYPVIYTGGISPYMWSPIVGIHTFDTPVYQIDISPFLPALWASSTKVDIRVRNGYNLTDVNTGWLINANIMTWETPLVVGHGNMELNNNSGSINGTSHDGDLNTKSVGGFLPTNSSVFEVVSLLRGLSRTANLDFNGHKIQLEWQQACMYDNIQYLSNRHDFRSIAQSTLCAENITISRPDNDGPNRLRSWQKMYEYPLAIQSAHDATKGRTDSEMTHSYEYKDSITDSIITTTQNASASSFDHPIDGGGRKGFGSNRQVYFYQDKEKTYQRVAVAYNNTLVIDSDSRNASIYTASHNVNNFMAGGEGPLSIKGNNVHIFANKFFDWQKGSEVLMASRDWSTEFLNDMAFLFEKSKIDVQ